MRTLAASDASSSFSSVVHESAAAEVAAAAEAAEELIFSQKLFAVPNLSVFSVYRFFSFNFLVCCCVYFGGQLRKSQNGVGILLWLAIK